MYPGQPFGMEPETLKNKHVERIPETLGMLLRHTGIIPLSVRY